MSNEYMLSFTGSEINERLDKVDRAILFEPQELTEEQKAQVRENIGVNENEMEAVLFTPQQLTDVEKAQARENIGAVTESDVVSIVSAAINSITNGMEVAY